MAKSSFGLDIGNYSVKLVEIDSEDGRHRLKNFSIVELYDENEEFEIEGAGYSRQVEAIKKSFKQLKVNPKRIRGLNCGVGGTNVAVKQIRSISLAAEELESSLSFEARKHLPLDDTDAIMDYQILDGGAEAAQMDILLVATTKKAFEYQVKLLKDLGVSPRIIDAESVALVNSYFLTRGKPESESALAFLDIGAKFSSLSIFSDHGIFFSREIAIGGHKLTEDVKSLHEVEYGEAEHLKREKGMGALLGRSDTEGSSIRVARRMALDGLIDEIRRSLRYYTKETGIRDFEKVLMSGGTASMPNLNSHLAKSLSMDVEIYNPFEMFTVPPAFNENIGSQLAIACGLALREE
ncbi:MAG: type IV pilus assembly protein PilM [candidate division Zixibacteria bacterium]